MPSLNSPSGSLGDEDGMSTFMSLQMDDDDPDLIKGPYIPMAGGDELSLLSDDVLWTSNNNEKTNNNSSSKSSDINSSLAQLLCSNVNKPCKVNDHGGGLIQSNNLLNDLYNEKSKLIFSTTLKELLNN